MNTVHKILDLLTPAERKYAYLLLGMTLIMALMDVMGVASILPFMAVLANPQLVETNLYLATVYNGFDFDNPQQFLFFLGGSMFVLVLVSLAFKALTNYMQLRFAFMREYAIGRRLVTGYLHQPYEWFLNRHSTDLGKTVLSEVSTVVSQGIVPLMTLCAQSIVTLALITVLLVVDTILAVTVSLVLAIAYGVIFKTVNGFLSSIGLERMKANAKRFSTLGEAFAAIKEIKLGGLEKTYIKRFATPAEAYARHQASAQVVAQLPRFGLEAFASGGMLLVVLYLMKQSGDFAAALPIMALYAFAGYRLIPALQQVYASYTSLRFAGPALDCLHTDLTSLPPIEVGIDNKGHLFPTKVISLNNITFTYNKAAQAALKGISLQIPVHNVIGLVGSTGSGKTTTVDVILGLLQPDKGTLSVDGQVIDSNNRRQWQKTIGYVPQQIYLADESIAANIAFGVKPENIDQGAVERAAKIANLHDFVVSELPQKYNTSVGERGVRLSGGQRQRIGIARALYHNPKVLILDEATSALDNLTEKAVMDAVNNLDHKTTIILIAHRLSTVRQCDQIYFLEKGRVKAQGTFDELQKIDAEFRAMASN